MRSWSVLYAGVAILGLALAPAVSASTITLSDVSSDATPASTLDATLDFMVIGGDELQLTVTNLTTAPNEFNINAAFWNTTNVVSGLTLTSATHSVVGDVFNSWEPVELGNAANGFGEFDYSLDNGVGENNPDVIQPGNNIVFLMDITGLCADTFSCTMNDFVSEQENGYIGAAKFVNGPDDPEAPGTEDSAWGAAVPEPGTALLFGSGLIGLAYAGRRRTQ
jgi:hypothetical protein